MNDFSKDYWNQRYLHTQTGWDIGNISTPLKDYFDQLTNKDLKILIPGAGNAWEVEYLYNNGFHNTYLLDFAEQSISNFKERCPDFPDANIIEADFFGQQGDYDLIVEQTFFSSLPPARRCEYATTISRLLNKGGKLVGLLFKHEFEFEGPPFGGHENEYRELFTKHFIIETMDTSTNSIKPRQQRELFLILRKP